MMQQCSTIAIMGVVLIVSIVLVSAAAILGGWALFSPPIRRWFLLAAGLASALAALAIGINAEWLVALDVSAEGWSNARRFRREAAVIYGAIGQPVYVAGAAMICGTLLALRARSALPGFLVVGGLGFGVGVERALKAMVGRTSTVVAELQQRTSPHNFEHTFPSGHVMGSVALLGMITLCLGVGRSRAVRTALAVTVVGVLFVGLLALYSKAHVLTDVIGGMLLGGAIVSLGAGVLSAANSRRTTTAAKHSTDPPAPSERPLPPGSGKVC